MKFFIGLIQFVLLVLLLRLLWNLIKQKFLRSGQDSTVETRQNHKKPSIDIDKSNIEDAEFEELDSEDEKDSSNA